MKADLKSGVFLISIGDELLDGRTQNSNASYFGEQLRLSGVPVAEVRSVSDRIEDIVGALKECSRYSLVVVTGGLGPTNDDRTLEAASKALKAPLKQTPASLKHVKSRYEKRGLPLTEARLKLALIPRGSKVLDNPTGTAPGVRLKSGRTVFYFLPGPPAECRPMFEKAILPEAKKLGAKRLVRRDFWRTFGKGESEIYSRIKQAVETLESEYPDTFAFGVHISFPCIDLTLEVWDIKGKKKPSAKEIQELASHISEELGDLCFTRERESLVEVVSRLLQERNVTLSTAESCTGGLLGKMFTDLSGCSACYLGGVISYSNPSKEEFLGVKKASLEKHGAVSDVVVKEMAEGIRARLKSDYSLSISGIAGPGGGNENKPVGTIYVGLSGKQGTKTLHQHILGGRGSRDQNRVIAAHLALDLLRNALRE